jgi:hypothetical protein
MGTTRTDAALDRCVLAFIAFKQKPAQPALAAAKEDA